MTSAQVIKTSVNVITNSPSQHYTHLDDHNLLTCHMGFVNFFLNIVFPIFVMYILGGGSETTPCLPSFKEKRQFIPEG